MNLLKIPLLFLLIILLRAPHSLATNQCFGLFEGGYLRANASRSKIFDAEGWVYATDTQAIPHSHIGHFLPRSLLARMKEMGLSAYHFPSPVFLTIDGPVFPYLIPHEGFSLVAAPGTIAARYTELAKLQRHIGQQDHRLAKVSLLREDGGLCGPVCAYNAVQSAAHFYGRRDSTFDRPVEVIRSLRQRYLDEKGVDLTLGVTSETFVTVVGELASQAGLRVESFEQIVGSRVSRENVMADPSEVTFINVDLGYTEHVLTYIGKSTDGKTLYYGDPNRPYEVLASEMESGPDGVSIQRVAMRPDDNTGESGGKILSLFKFTLEP